MDNNISFRKLERKKRSALYVFLNNILKNPYVLIAPAVLVALATVIWPMIFCIYVSLQKWDMMTNTMTFVGLKNYRFIFTDEAFLKTMKNTVIFLVVTVFGGILLQLLLGVMFCKDSRRHNLVQTVMFTPHIIASVAIATIWMYLMAPGNGLLNIMIKFFGGQALAWYRDSSTALMSIIIISIWNGLGYGVLIVVAGLKGIPGYIYEAARLDRSSPLKTLTHITIPLLSPTLLYMLVTSTAGAFASFDTVKLLTNGGPDNSTSLIALYVYQQGFEYAHYGRAMAAAVVLMIVSSSLAMLNFTITRNKIHYQ